MNDTAVLEPVDATETVVESPYLKLLVKLTSDQLRDLWGAIAEHEACNFAVPEDDDIYDEAGQLLLAETIARTLADKLTAEQVPHVEVVLAAASLPDHLIAEALMEKPIHKGPKSGGARPAGSAPKGERAPRASVAISDTRIIYDVKPNPKKVGSAAHGKFALYKEGMSVKDFIAAGGTMADVKWDSERQFIKLKDA